MTAVAKAQSPTIDPASARFTRRRFGLAKTSRAEDAVSPSALERAMAELSVRSLSGPCPSWRRRSRSRIRANDVTRVWPAQRRGWRSRSSR